MGYCTVDILSFHIDEFLSNRSAKDVIYLVVLLLYKVKILDVGRHYRIHFLPLFGSTQL